MLPSNADRLYSDQLLQLGLVSSKSSETPIVVNRNKARLAKMKRKIYAAVAIHNNSDDYAKHKLKSVFTTLTYASTKTWSSKHITAYIANARIWAKRKGFRLRYVWVLELTKLGVPHYHVLLWIPEHLTLPKPDQSWWKQGMSKIETVRRVGSIAGYLSKGSLEQFEANKPPRGARLYGVGGFSANDKLVAAWVAAPQWVRERWPSPNYKPKKRKGGGWVSTLTGEWVPSPWQTQLQGCRIIMVPVS